MNPAITLAQCVLGRKTWIQVLVYTPAQLLGTFAATACAYSDYICKKKPQQNSLIFQ